MDITTTAGRRLARAFELSTGPGLIISNRGSAVQAFRHKGKLSNEMMGLCLARYADSDRVVRETETDDAIALDLGNDQSASNRPQARGTDLHANWPTVTGGIRNC
jgi:hypothetical protein